MARFGWRQWLVLIAATPACTAAMASGHDDAASTVTIESTYHGPCRGLCPSFEWIVRPDGHIIIRVDEGMRPGRIKAEKTEIEEFMRILAPLRDGAAHRGICAPSPRWYIELAVKWTNAATGRQVTGCNDAAFSETVERALRTLRIDEDSMLTGSRR